MSLLIRGCVVFLSIMSSIPTDAADFFFHDGDVIVMVGDSITEQHLYSNYVEMWTVTRFPEWKLTFRNVGIGGDRSVGGNSRFARDVLLHHPTAMTVDFGMNDGSYRAFGDDTFKPFMDGLQGMADQAATAGIRTAWITPQPLDTDEQGPTALTGYNETLEKFSAGTKAIADKNQGLFVDQFHPYLDVLNHARGQGPKYTRITAGDAVHPGPPGQALMAASILKGLSFPALVSSVELDGSAGKLTAATNCTVENIRMNDGRLSFSRRDGALPFFPADAAGILPWAPILEELNDYRLKVTGLPSGMYAVQVDGTKIAEMTAEQLAAGTNLAAAALQIGPIADQVKAVRAAVENKNRYHHDMIFRGIVLSSVPEWIYSVIPQAELEVKKQAVIQERLAMVATLDAEISKSLEMKAHTVELIPIN
jgi:lysophospholipase L1-like esterase